MTPRHPDPDVTTRAGAAVGALLIRTPDPAEDSRPPISVWPLARAIYASLPRRVRRGWLLLIGLTGLCSLAELATTALLLDVIRLATQPPGASPRSLLSDLPGASLFPGGARTAVLATALVTSVFLLRGALALALTAATNSATVATGIDLSERLLSHYVRVPYGRFRLRRVADLQRSVMVLAKTVVSQVLRPGVQLVTDTALIGAVLSIMVIASPWATLAAALLVIGMSAILIRTVTPRLYRAAALVEKQDRSANVFVDQVLHGRREITLRHHEAAVLSSYVEERRAASGPSRRTAIFLELPRLVIEGVTMILVTSLIIFAIALELDTPRVVASLGLFAYALLRLMPLVGRVTTNLASFRAGLPILDDLWRDLPTLPADANVTATELTSPTLTPSALTGPVEFRRVSAEYEGSRHPVLHEVTVRIEAGHFVAVVGPSGAGKSTFIDLLLGLLAPTSGEVLIAGRPLRELARGWQAGVGVVSQEPYIFNDSILRNIVLFADSADERRVMEVLDEVGLRDLVARLPHGLHTRIGERGSALSGGQRQRLAVARALYSNPALLVLDEATSALDAHGEATILKAALGHGAPRTLVVVTHRASAIVDCDQVIVLEDGRVTATGSYDDALAKSPYFRLMVRGTVSDQST